MMFKHLCFAIGLIAMWSVKAQQLRFAHVTDTHIGGSTGVEDLERTVADINSMPDIEFILVTGDITEFGSEAELLEARHVLQKLSKPYYVVPGNHDSKWSESGCNDFVRIFGSETFVFEKEGILFIGTASGPNMRMAPGLVPREQVVFLDSVLTNMKNPEMPVFFVNHYPLDESLANFRIIINLLKTRNIQVTLLGHGHANKLFNFNGIPGIMGRSNLRAKNENGGFNIGTIKDDTLYYAERTTGQQTNQVWCKIQVNFKSYLNKSAGNIKADIIPNENTTHIKKIWEYQEKSDIGAGFAAKGSICVYTGTDGQVIARNISDGSVRWKFRTGGKIYSTPAIKNNRVVCPSTDGRIYCLDLEKGKVYWSFKTGKPIVASPVIRNNRVFIGSSEGVFRAIRLKEGKLEWQFDSIRNFIETKPLLYKRKIYFGSWGNSFYSLDQKTGNLVWKREKYNNRMLSPAAVWPVAARGKIFIAAPDRRMTALDAETGKEIWDSGTYSCRESIGLSKNGKLVYIKNMTEGNVDAFYTWAGSQELAWECKAGLGYEIAPSPITEKNDLVFVPTTSGIIYSINKQDHQVAWKYKLSDALINYILPINKNRILVTTFDGKVACLDCGK